MFEWFKAWQRRETLKSVARRMAPALRKQWRFQEYYTREQVLETARRFGLTQESRLIAIAMFAHPEQAGVDPKLAQELKALKSSRSGADSDGGSDPNFL
jgi:hypothetical protein